MTSDHVCHQDLVICQKIMLYLVLLIKLAHVSFLTQVFSHPSSHGRPKPAKKLNSFFSFLEPSEMIALTKGTTSHIFKRIEWVFSRDIYAFVFWHSKIWPQLKWWLFFFMVCNHFLFEFQDWIHRQKEDQIDRCVRKRHSTPSTLALL